MFLPVENENTKTIFEKHIELTNIPVNAQGILLYYGKRMRDEMVHILNLNTKEAKADRTLCLKADSST